MNTISGEPMREKFCAFFAGVFIEAHLDRDGQPFVVESAPDLADLDTQHEISEGILPTYIIRFPDGHVMPAWPEEVEYGWERGS